MIGLSVHAGAYVAGNAWLALSPLESSPLWPLAGWGLILLVHALRVASR